MLLDRIQQPNDIKTIPEREWSALAQEMRDYMVRSMSKSGGDIASNLGVVELAMALHLTFDLSEDKVIWDGGYQAGAHRLLLGHRDDLSELRTYGGGRSDASFGAFETGHSSSAVSAGLGYVRARELTGGKYQVVSVIGDGALTGGMVYEALNNASELSSNFTIILNDNGISVSDNVGGIAQYLDQVRSLKAKKSPIRRIKKRSGSLSGEIMRIPCLGPVDGHDIKQMKRVLEEARKIDQAVIVHVVTKKGKGYAPAEENPASFHGIGPFDMKTGEPVLHSTKATCTSVFARSLMEEAEADRRVVAVTAAMADWTGLKAFSQTYPDRFFDVGIAEEHAVTFSAGLAAGGLIPVVCIYSSFLQRGFDQIIHDVCLQNLHVVFMVDRAGLVGNDGETQQGLFDLSYLTMIPNMTVMSPKNKWELAAMLHFAIAGHEGPIAIRYPRGTAFDMLKPIQKEIKYGKSELIIHSREIAVLSEGHMMKTALRVVKMLEENGYHPTLVNARFIKPIDTALLTALSKDHQLFVTIEENMLTGGYGEQVAAFVNHRNLPVRVMSFGIDDKYVKQGRISVLKKAVGLDWESIAEKLLQALKET